MKADKIKFILSAFLFTKFTKLLQDMLKKEAVLNAIENTGGIISHIAARLGVEWHTANKYINKWQSTKHAFDNEREKLIDAAESVVLKAINDDKDIQTAKWLLATLGKHRGFSEKYELETKQTINVKGYVNISPDDWNDNSKTDGNI